MEQRVSLITLRAADLPQRGPVALAWTLPWMLSRVR